MTPRNFIQHFAVSLLIGATCSPLAKSFAREASIDSEKSPKISHQGGAALFQQSGGDTWILLGPSKNADSVSTRHDRNRVDFLEPDEKGFSRIIVKTWIDRSFVRAEFRRNGSKYRLVRLASSSTDRLFATDFDEVEVVGKESAPIVRMAVDPRCSESVVVQTARTTTMLAALTDSCSLKSAEIANSWEMVRGPSVPPAYLQCVKQVVRFDTLVSAITLELEQGKIAISCDESTKLSSFSSGTITLGSSAFENRESMNRALFHEFLHRGSLLEDESVIAELENCCAGAYPNPSNCSDMKEFRDKLGVLADNYRIQYPVIAAAMRERSKRSALLSLINQIQGSRDRVQVLRRFCAEINVAEDECLGSHANGSWAEGKDNNNLRAVTTAPSRIEPVKTGPAPTIPTRVTFTPGDVTSVAAMRPQVERFRSAAVTMTDHTQRSFAALKAGASNVAVASPRRTTSGSRTASRQASRSVPVEFESQIERVEANRTVLRTPMGLVAMTVPHSESTGLGEIRVERAELPNIPVPASQLVTRESNRSGNARGLAPARRDSSSDVSDQQGSTSSGSAAAGASSAGGSAQAQASAPSRGPRGPAGGGDFASRNTRWEDSLKGPSDIRRVLSDPAYSDRETLLRDTDFMARVSELKVQLIYQRRRYGPSDWQTRIDLDVQIPTESARPSR